MTKELKALEQLKYYNTLANDDFDMTEELSIIGTALKRLEEIDKAYQNLPIDFRKVIKALEIIKEIAKLYFIDFCDKDQTMSFEIRYRNKYILETVAIKNKENYNLLKEVLL